MCNRWINHHSSDSVRSFASGGSVPGPHLADARPPILQRRQRTTEVSDDRTMTHTRCFLHRCTRIHKNTGAPVHRCFCESGYTGAKNTEYVSSSDHHSLLSFAVAVVVSVAARLPDEDRVHCLQMRRIAQNLMNDD
eukprot:GHVU01225691.1.p1 GENE.GHVU01225691.1~~GHVU01225691.1.p1  ORF type:complete len:136 (+),score=1.83 GHVU01225691.1:219-626(+)